MSCCKPEHQYRHEYEPDRISADAVLDLNQLTVGTCQFDVGPAALLNLVLPIFVSHGVISLGPRTLQWWVAVWVLGFGVVWCGLVLGLRQPRRY